MAKLIQGTYAAAVTPRTSEGALDIPALRTWLRFLLSAGIRGFALNGATGEFPLITASEVQQLLETASEELKGKAEFLVGVGTAGTTRSIELGKLAVQAGAQGLLLPMPSFFPYAQDDLASFSRSVTAKIDLPILLYNLPQFTTGLAPETSLNLIRECENIIGIKDSSGSLDTVRLLKREAPEACRIIGNDNALIPALQEDLADGVISGVACVLPELMQQIFSSGASAANSPLGQLLKAFIAQLDVMPTPWGLKVMAEARAIAPATFPFPRSSSRIQQSEQLIAWFHQNSQTLCARLASE